MRNALDEILFRWPDGSAFSLHHMLRSVSVKGITGSGKSSGSGRHFLDAIIRHPKSTLLGIAQKPEEKEEWFDLFKKYKRDLIIVEPDSKWTCDFLGAEVSQGADSRALTEFAMTLGEILEGSKGREGEQFWKKLEERITYNAIEAVRQGDVVSAPNLMEFITTSAFSREMVENPTWKNGYHFKVMDAATKRAKTEIEKHDYRVIKSFWGQEWIQLDDKPRSSGMAQVMNTLHTFNTGLVRSKCASGSNFGPWVIDRGVSVLVNYPFPDYGPTGRFIAGGLKYLWEKYILRRKWKPTGYFNVIFCDEFQESVSDFDGRYIAQARSHGGCLFTLVQTIHSEYLAAGTHAGHHKVDALQSNFGMKIFHLADFDTAKKVSEMLGMRKQLLVGGDASPSENTWDAIMGFNSTKMSYSESWQPILQPSELMSSMRTGGAANNYVVDGLVVRAGEPFKNGENFLWCAFKQK